MGRYGKSLYGLEKYAQNQTYEEVPEEYFVELSRYVPPFIAELFEMSEIYRTDGYEVGALQYFLDDLLSQCFVITATWDLIGWEALFGITTNLALSYEQRREIVMAKFRGQGTTTKQMLRETAAAFSGGEVDVIEHSGRYHFIVRFIGIKGIPRNMQAFISMLEEIKPAHLSYEFQYTYTVWDNIMSMTWGEMKGKTYNEVKVMEGV